MMVLFVNKKCKKAISFLTKLYFCSFSAIFLRLVLELWILP
jgi:hypothetical protein